MKYKILKGTETFGKLAALYQHVKECRLAAQNLAAELSDIEDKDKVSSLSSGFHLAGGIVGVSMANKPSGYRDVKGYYGYYFPKKCKANKDILDRIEALPKVSTDDLNSIIGFEEQSSGMRWFTCPAVQVKDDYALIKISEECYFTANEDMIEILDSEYRTLSVQKP